jgi:hypothetical protein
MSTKAVLWQIPSLWYLGISSGTARIRVKWKSRPRSASVDQYIFSLHRWLRPRRLNRAWHASLCCYAWLGSCSWTIVTTITWR